MYLRTNNKVSSQGFQKLEHKQDRQSDTQTDRRDRTHYHAALAGGKSVRWCGLTADPKLILCISRDVVGCNIVTKLRHDSGPKYSISALL